MKKVEFDRYLDANIPKATLLYGECEFLISYCSAIVLSKIDPKDFKPMSMYFDYEHKSAMNYLGTNSLFGGLNILVLKMNKVMSDSVLKELFSVLENNKNSYLVVEFYKATSNNDSEYAMKFREMARRFKPTQKLKDIIEMRCFEPFYDEKMRILIKRAEELGLKIDSSKLQHILDVQNNDIGMAYNELEKFVYYPQITHSLIDELSFGLGGVKIDSLYDSIFEKKGHLPYILQMLNEEGIDNMELLKDVSRYFYILFRIYGYARKHGSINAKEALGYTPPQHILNAYTKRSMKMKAESFCALFDILNDWRVGQMQGKNVAMQSLIAMQGAI